MKKHPLHYINRLAWNILRKIPRVKTWGAAFRGAIRVLRRRDWQAQKAALTQHFLDLSRRYAAAGDAGRMFNFRRAARIVPVTRSYPDFTRRHGVDTQNRAEAVEFSIFGTNTRRMETLR